jgi:hypothetical protein
MNADDETQVVLPAQHTQEYVVEVGDLYIIGEREHPRHNRTDVI